MKMGTQQGADPGDDSVILRVHLRWVDTVPLVMTPPSGPPVGTVWRRADGIWELVFSISRGPRNIRQRHFVAIDPMGTRRDCWQMIRLGPGVWDLDPSLHVPTQIHAFLVLIGAPEPAPWSTP